MKNVVLQLSFFILILSFSSCKDQNDASVLKNTTTASDYKNDTQKPSIDELVGVKLTVDKVEQNKDALDTYPAVQVFEHFLGKEISYNPHMKDTNFKLVPINGSGLINTIDICYGQHRPLVLSPDIIWMTIAQGITTHINQNFKDLEAKIFTNNKPNQLLVRNDSLEFGAKHWNQLINDLSDSTKKYTQKDMFKLLAPQFSTTSPEIQTAYKANILYGYKKAFTYVGEGGCGIPYITIQGSQEDWIHLKNNLNLLDSLNLEYWHLELNPIIDQFINVYDQKTDTLFWKNIYKEFADYGRYNITGWIIKLYPYLEVLGAESSYNEENGMMKVNHQFIKNPYLKGDLYLSSDLSVEDFPVYKSECDIVWNNHFKNETKTMHLFSGIMGAQQFSDGSLKPWITWAITLPKAKDAETIKLPYIPLEHRSPNWTPTIYQEHHQYQSKSSWNNLNHAESIDALTNQLKNHLSQKFQHVNDSLNCIIMANGKPIISSKNEELEKTAQSFINQNGIKWKPATMKLGDIMEMIEDIDPNHVIAVNSSFIISL